MTLLNYLKENAGGPYSGKFAKKLGISRQHLGDIAHGKKRASLSLAMDIKEVTGGQVTMEELEAVYRAKQTSEQEAA